MTSRPRSRSAPDRSWPRSRGFATCTIPHALQRGDHLVGDRVAGERHGDRCRDTDRTAGDGRGCADRQRTDAGLVGSGDQDVLCGESRRRRAGDDRVHFHLDAVLDVGARTGCRDRRRRRPRWRPRSRARAHRWMPCSSPARSRRPPRSQCCRDHRAHLGGCAHRGEAAQPVADEVASDRDADGDADAHHAAGDGCRGRRDERLDGRLVVGGDASRRPSCPVAVVMTVLPAIEAVVCVRITLVAAAARAAHREADGPAARGERRGDREAVDLRLARRLDRDGSRAHAPDGRRRHSRRRPRCRRRRRCRWCSSPPSRRSTPPRRRCPRSRPRARLRSRAHGSTSRRWLRASPCVAVMPAHDVLGVGLARDGGRDIRHDRVDRRGSRTARADAHGAGAGDGRRGRDDERADALARRGGLA